MATFNFTLIVQLQISHLISTIDTSSEQDTVEEIKHVCLNKQIKLCLCVS
jgi:hypothetical protein